MAQRSVSRALLRQMSAEQQKVIGEKEKESQDMKEQHERYKSGLSLLDRDLSAIVRFLRSKIKVVNKELKFQTAYLAGLSDLAPTQDIIGEREQVFEAVKPLLQEFHSMLRTKRGLSDDVQDLVVAKKRCTQPKDGETDGNIIDQAFAESMRMICMAASKKKKSSFDQSKFRRDVTIYYGSQQAISAEFPEGRAYCFLTGWWLPKQVKAAHIVPKSISESTMEYLFGSEERNASQLPRNALMLHQKLEESLDSGSIAIIPILSPADQITRWKCILVDQDLRDLMVYQRVDSFGRAIPGSQVRYRDIDDKELTFLNNNRPARRFLYFRFIITILQAVYNGRTNVLDELKIDTYGRSFWASQGEYLRKSSLTALTRAVAGLKLPDELLDNTTFDDNNNDDDDDDDDDDEDDDDTPEAKMKENDSRGERMLEELAAAIDISEVLRPKQKTEETLTSDSDYDHDGGEDCRPEDDENNIKKRQDIDHEEH